jgi:hypothetical protein
MQPDFADIVEEAPIDAGAQLASRLSPVRSAVRSGDHPSGARIGPRGPGGTPMTDPSEATDGEVLRLRSTGRAFARISRDLGLQRPVDAQRAFQRAVRRLPLNEQDQIRQQESSRLDRLAARVNADTTTTVEDRTRRLAAIDRLRVWLTEDH